MKRLRKKFKKYFIPHEENDFKPHLLRPRTIAFICIVMIVAEFAFLTGQSQFSDRSKLSGVILANALVDGTNQNRVLNKLPMLTPSPLLQAAAQEKANDMAKYSYFAHTSPAGVTPWFWFQNVGYNFAYAGENLAINFSDSADVTSAWMNSPEHRANILDTNYTQIGMATATGTYQGQPTIYVVELFGSPAVTPIAFVNTASAARTPVILSSPVTSKKPAQPKTVASKPIPEVTTVVATNASQSANAQQLFVAVKGAETEAATNTNPAVIPTQAAATVPAPDVALQNNPLQDTVASPRHLTNYLYYILIAILGFALAFDIFIKIRIQHPQLIAGGVFAIAIAAIFIVLNQQVLLAHGIIF